MRRNHRAALMLTTGMAGCCGTAAAQEAREISFAQMFLWSDTVLGVLIILALQLMSLVTLAMIIQLVLKYRRRDLLPDASYRRIEDLLRSRRYREAINVAGRDASYLGQLASAAMNDAPGGYAAMQRAIEEAADVHSARLLRPVELLNVIGNIAPMLGLFGTVYGMIVAFQQLVAAGGRPDPGQLAGGISTALVTTFWGLVVAMPALAAYALIRNHIDAIVGEGVVLADNLIRPFKPGVQPGIPVAGAAPDSAPSNEAAGGSGS